MARWSWRRAYIQVRRVLACLCTIGIVYIEYLGSVGNRTVLVGGLLPAAPGNVYASPLLPTFLQTLLSGGYNGTLPSPPAFLYLEANESRVDLCERCREALPGDRIYTPSYLTLVLTKLLPLQLDDSHVLVDCAYTGRATEDTTALKAYVLSSTSLTTVFLQTMVVQRPAKHRQAGCGTATVVSLPLDAINATDMTSRLVADPTSPAINDVYQTYVGLDFPYEVSTPFVPVRLATGATVSGAWTATLGHEVVSLLGTEGIFRGTTATQGNYAYYVWSLPSDPLAFAFETVYTDASHSKDANAWLRLLVGAGIAFNATVSLLVALVSCVHLYRETGVLWVPDLFPCIQYRVQVRAALCACVLYLTDWWHVFEWSLAEANARLGLPGTFVYPAMALADALMVALALLTWLTHALHVRIGLEAIVLILFICFKYRTDLTTRIGLCLQATDEYATANFESNSFSAGADGMDVWTIHENAGTAADAIVLILFICFKYRTDLTTRIGLCLQATDEYATANFESNSFSAGADGMDVWTIHENAGTDFCVVACAFTWWLVALAAASLYILGAKVVWPPRQTPRMRRFKSIFIRPRSGAFRFWLGDDVPTDVRLWTERSLLYAPFRPSDASAGWQVERSTRQRVEDVVGFVAACDETTDDGRVSISSLWLLGHIIVDDRFLMAINSYPRWLLNALLNRRLFRVERVWTDLAPLRVQAMP
ncbi:hypothetical protein SPRG_05806 [Saprolegnia parasitica CBS 223.65]|uniref:Uncharacterized protein n=1 Tax=Saprolegnia parasitica (strain CBS 223.65) TaxID=695850 RepID=A0A067CEJ8_SAPPC|nr:hypothetical protein SPRG_05806 [Saprolegnia parasitica CBS 223.65]KDO28933.1 hypothetical protein SPRG_05806 [Saprolegnia parasitica CBS 223.65]|eukprot:XP_012200474.1 hypothetical protein SPRG_05806 [Saprolegnia parasitica CBS 223.65]